MSAKVQNRLNAIEKDVARLHELFGEKKYRSGSTLHDLHTMILNTDFLIYNIKVMGENQTKMEQQHQQQIQKIMIDYNLMSEFIKSKGQHNEYPLYRKEMLEKQEEKRKEAEAKARAEAAAPTEGSDRATDSDTPPGSEGKPGA